ncbi:teichoic acid biosynthesis protein [Staphylococcus microti]|uniref:TarF-like protein n=1 Tax=Staphylococcus microti TaxID=569857 RepID=A0A0D6XPV6_9STAP|nr:glycosyltransferase [Staphylococcus microti]KIX90430.1 teichoic acid biosynthesis protein [Staphylococcus microti]PNZ84712.1 teichoic acid biosynthesis protein [Staphylococcus microti]SUM58449.1 TarF-like protein [Staphylococcus microti]
MKKIAKVLLNQVKRKYNFVSGPLKARLRSAYVNKVTKYAAYYKKNPTVPTYILYQSYDGKSLADSPYAVFLYLINHVQYQDFTHFWVVESEKMKMVFENQYGQHDNVRFIVKESDEYLHVLTTAKYLLNNATFPEYFTKKEDQIYVNTWHGTPIKAMGLDVEDNLLGSQNVIKNFLSSDILVSPNAHTTSIFKKAFALEGLYNGQLMEIGYPRIDLTINSQRETVLKDLKSQGIHIGDQKVLLFAPTWRGQDVHQPEDSIESIYQMIMELKAHTNYQVLVKVHPFVYELALEHQKILPYLIPDTFDTNELLSVVDLLVTDYSSIFFDYLVTDNPIIFYAPDYEAYKSNRGLYIDFDALPGPSADDLEDLIVQVKKAENNALAYHKNYETFKKAYVAHEDGHVTEKVVQAMFHSQKIEEPKTKERILIHPGGMKNNGITTSVVNLLENLDYDKYDVTIVLDRRIINADVLGKLQQLNKNIRIILRNDPLLATTTEIYQNTFIGNRGIQPKLEKFLYPKLMFEREFRKIFGNAVFDYVVDFSGYAMFWPKILLGTVSKKKLILLHSDIQSDMNRTVNGKKPHYLNLKGVMTMYPKFDYLVSVSEETCRLNMRNLSTPTTRKKFVSVMNTINIKRIETLIDDESDFFIEHDTKMLTILKNDQIKGIEFNDKDFKVMAMGRLSPEKGFDILITGFKAVVQQNPEAKLYILGEGPLRKELQNLIKSLHLENNVYLVGQKGNPFNIMKQCDLFVLSSHYEGQSMVLLEALTIGTNVLASDIPANRYVLDSGKYGMLVNNTPERVGAGILQFMNGEAPSYQKFDVHQHNEQALKQFYRLLQ